MRLLLSLLFPSAQPTVLPQSGNSSLREGQTKVPRCLTSGARFLMPETGIRTIYFGNTAYEVSHLSYVNPAIRPQFDSMPADLKEHILQMNIRLETMNDLMGCLERIIAEEKNAR